MNHTEAKHSFSDSLARLARPGLLALPALMAALVSGCIAAGEVDSGQVESSDRTEHQNEVRAVDERSNETAETPEQAKDEQALVEEPVVEERGLEAHDLLPQADLPESTAVVAAASSPTDTPQPSPWKGHNPPPSGPAAGPPTSDSNGP